MLVLEDRTPWPATHENPPCMWCRGAWMISRCADGIAWPMGLTHILEGQWFHLWSLWVIHTLRGYVSPRHSSITGWGAYTCMHKAVWKPQLAWCHECSSCKMGMGLSVGMWMIAVRSQKGDGSGWHCMALWFGVCEPGMAHMGSWGWQLCWGTCN